MGGEEGVGGGWNPDTIDPSLGLLLLLPCYIGAEA